MKPNVLNLTDFCKGLAIALVVLVHYRGGWFGWQGVHIFIVLSGLGLAYSCAKQPQTFSWVDWFIRRMRRVLPVYWIAVIFSFPLLAYLTTLNFAVTRTILDFFLLTNVFEDFRGEATGAFWYIPFIIGAYLLFPILYNRFQKYSTWQGYSIILLITIAIEFIYRGIAIYYLDGLPIAHTDKFLDIFPTTVKALNHYPDWFFGFFQRRSPFGFILARIGEFTLGMVAGLVLAKNSNLFHKIIINPYMGWLGFLIWLGGQSLLYSGLWGWIFTDFVIALGMILWIINLADFTHKKIPLLFKAVSLIGIWSYYIYLTHQPFTRLFPQIKHYIMPHDPNLLTDLLTEFLFLGTTLVTIYFASDLARRFDQSKIPSKMIVQFTPMLNYLLAAFKKLWFAKNW
ncbi:conserved membrane hypothetical protein [Planktothrix serta PCC 8927]|uniref:Acyltransferase 3 domain-containing protein n=1 Tax=Planktothrix serta PCC 8927 TaxID=671068 RepID=A0A7Z9C093_9CYAN|nr:acyltransferase family protein [Planktothrix serta]VXD22846.1 conserved membrane hypothetical protein [Planktothrix serta PCC 8927]